MMWMAHKETLFVLAVATPALPYQREMEQRLSDIELAQVPSRHFSVLLQEGARKIFPDTHVEKLPDWPEI